MMMKTTTNAQTPSGCGRHEELVAYLYDEASEMERASFERHLEACRACRDELRAFEHVREDLGAWQLPLAPRVEIAPRRGKLGVLGELLGLFPLWARAATAVTAAAAVLVVALAIAGTRVEVGPAGAAVNFGLTAKNSTGGGPGAIESQSASAAPEKAQTITRAAAAALVRDAVAQAQAQAQDDTRAQLAGLEERLSAEHQIQLSAVTKRLRAENRAILAKASEQQPTIREWLFAANETRDGGGTEK
jgi:hypothetical protein